MAAPPGLLQEKPGAEGLLRPLVLKPRWPQRGHHQLEVRLLAPGRLLGARSFLLQRERLSGRQAEPGSVVFIWQLNQIGF